MISDNSEMKGILQKVSRSFLNAQKFLFTALYIPLGSSQTICLDYLISPNFSKNEYTRMLGKVQNYLEKCGIVFASFLFGKFILDCLVTSFFTQVEQTEKIEQECDQKIQAPLLEEIDKIQLGSHVSSHPINKF